MSRRAPHSVLAALALVAGLLAARRRQRRQPPP
ncbi:hypothetical protein HDA31_005651 [Micromonospora carbonacea subsp. aurantiaca]|nr:hypothetical protein [Micromonospora carbonacea]